MAGSVNRRVAGRLLRRSWVVNGCERRVVNTCQSRVVNILKHRVVNCCLAGIVNR